MSSKVTTTAAETKKAVMIKPINLQTACLSIVGTEALLMNAFGKTAQHTMMENQMAGPTKKGKKERKAKDFDVLYEECIHYSRDGKWIGIPCAAFRQGAIRSCSLVGYAMTLAKMSIFIQADGFDRDSKQPLVKITEGKPSPVDHMVKLATGVVDIKRRPMWDAGWKADVRVRWDADQFTLEDVVNIFNRLGQQVGILAGRPNSVNSSGMGCGTFLVEGVGQAKQVTLKVA